MEINELFGIASSVYKRNVWIMALYSRVETKGFREIRFVELVLGVCLFKRSVYLAVTVDVKRGRSCSHI